MKFAWNTIGQEDIIDNLTELSKNSNLPNSLIFTGQLGIGKSTLAIEFAKYLNCLGDANCDSCIRFENANHPDLFIIDTDSKCSDNSCCKKDSTGTIIKNCVINESVISSIKFNPLIGNYKVIVINQADKLSKTSYESLLKTLEEVNGNIIIILIVQNIKNIPETIVSRCQQWKLKNIDKEKLHENLLNKFPEKNIDIEKIISFGSPTIGESIEMLSDPIFFEERQNSIERIIEIINAPNSRKLEYSKDLISTFRKDRNRLFFELSIWKKLFHEILSSKNLDYLQRDFSLIKKIIGLNKIKLKKNIDIVSQTEKLITQNVNPTLCLDNMLLSLETK